MNTFIKIFFLSISIVPIICIGQEGPTFLGFIPNSTPPSPNAYELGKYGQVQVGLYTGSVNFDLPLYTYKTKHLSVPISLQYNSNGIKVDQIESAVGLGWSLNAGGIITTIARNRSDELSDCMYPPVEIETIDQAGAAEFFSSVGNGGGDAEPDLYMFNFMGYSGLFVFDKDHNIVQMPLQDLKIEENEDEGFTITCSDGVKYFFNDKETVMTRLCCYVPLPPYEERVNAWYLSKIVHPYGDKIIFEYFCNNLTCTTAVSQTYVAIDPPGQIVCGIREVDDPGVRGPYYHKSINTCQSLTRIFSDNFEPPDDIEEPGEVIFSSEYPSPTSPGYKLFNNISVHNRYNEEIERFEFNYTTTIANQRVFLEGVHFKDPEKSYHMEYISPELLPPRLSFAQDHWGYYNGATSNVNFYPEIPDDIYFSGINGANKEPNGEHSVYGLLNKIIYPTKGYSEIIYEPNDYYGLKHESGQYTTISLYVETGEEGFGQQYADETIIESVANQYIRISVNVNEINNQYPEECSGFPPDRACAWFRVIDNSTGYVLPLYIYIQGVGYVLRGGGDLFYPNGMDNICYAYLDLDKSYTLSLWPKSFCMSSLANIKYLEVAPYEFYTNIETGGQRVKSKVDHDPVTGKDEIKRYYYYQKDDPEKSCGVNGQKAQYITPTVFQVQCSEYVQNPAYYMVLGASSLCPLFNTHNNNIYYPNVTISFGGHNFENGGELHEFFNNEDTQGIVLFGKKILESPWTNSGWRTGLESKSTVFKVDNSGSKILLMETLNEYSTYQNQSINHVAGYAIRKKDTYLVPEPGDIYNLDITKYQNYSYWKYPISSTIKLYDEDGLNPVSTTINYFYDNIDHLQLTRTEKLTNDGVTKITKQFFPDDVPDLLYRNILLQQYRIAEKVMEEEYINSQKVSSSRVTYNDWGNNYIHPEFITSSTYDNPLEPRARFYSINTANGNPLEFSKENDIHTSLLWGYQDTKPVIKGENVSYNDLVTAVNQTNANIEQLLSPNGIGDLTLPAQRNEWKNFNTTLRSHPSLQHAMITTYTYKSLVGLTSSTDPTGLTTYYEYDSFGRLIYVRDNDYSILKKYDYHYKE